MLGAAASYIAINSRGAYLKWKLSSASDLAGYEVWIAKNQGGPYSKLNENLLTKVVYLTPELRFGIYYFVVTVVDKAGNRSLRSNEARIEIY